MTVMLVWFQTQYRLIYDTLAMFVQVWNTVIPSSQLPAVTHKLLLKDPQANCIGYEKEFQVTPTECLLEYCPIKLLVRKPFLSKYARRITLSAQNFASTLSECLSL